MSAEPSIDATVNVSLHDYRVLRAVERRASAEVLDAALYEVVHEELQEWEAAGRPGAKTHEEFMTELFGASWVAEHLGEPK